jgi:hypothetical protein
MGNKFKSARGSVKLLAILTVCLALLYPLAEAVNSLEATGSDTEFEILLILFVLAMLVVLIRLVLIVFQMLISRSVHMTAARIYCQQSGEPLSVDRPPGFVPLLI